MSGLAGLVWAYVEGPKKLGMLEPRFLGIGRWLTFWKRAPPPVLPSYQAKFGHSRSQHRTVIMEIRQKKNPSKNLTVLASPCWPGRASSLSPLAVGLGFG